MSRHHCNNNRTQGSFTMVSTDQITTLKTLSNLILFMSDTLVVTEVYTAPQFLSFGDNSKNNDSSLPFLEHDWCFNTLLIPFARSWDQVQELWCGERIKDQVMYYHITYGADIPVSAPTPFFKFFPNVSTLSRNRIQKKRVFDPASTNWQIYCL